MAWLEETRSPAVASGPLYSPRVVMLKAPTVCVVVPVRFPPSKMLDSPEFTFEAVEIEVVPD